jgi:hypothetical protein
MPQSATIIRLTSDEATAIGNATNSDQVKAVISVLTKLVGDNNKAIRDLKNGPLTREQFENAHRAATDNLEFIAALPESEDRDALSASLTETVQIIDQGLKMHSENGA